MSCSKKIAIIGTSGCGKTTLSKRLSTLLGIEFTDLDDLFWLPGWVRREDEDFESRVKNAVKNESWILCGNYSKVRDIYLSEADLILWLDYPLSTCLFRTFKRTLCLILFKKPTCNTNAETWRRFFGKKSILLWIWQTHSRRRKEYSILRYPVTQIRNQQELEEFIQCQFKSLK